MPAEGIGDPALTQLVAGWIDDLERNYRELVAGIPASWLEQGELDYEAVIEDIGDAERQDADDSTTGLPSPVRARVEERTKGAVGERELVATHLLLIEGRPAIQPDGVAATAEERWRIRGHRLSDGTIMPCWGSFRVASAAT